MVMNTTRYTTAPSSEQLRIPLACHTDRLCLQNPPGGAPGFEKKFLQLAAISVHRGMTEDRPIASLGTVVINLADFTDVKRGPKKLAFRVSVGREVTNALSSIGKPEAPSLIVTMQYGTHLRE